jgi:hypothetical protein
MSITAVILFEFKGYRDAGSALFVSQNGNFESVYWDEGLGLNSLGLEEL